MNLEENFGPTNDQAPAPADVRGLRTFESLLNKKGGNLSWRIGAAKDSIEWVFTVLEYSVVVGGIWSVYKLTNISSIYYFAFVGQLLLFSYIYFSVFLIVARFPVPKWIPDSLVKLLVEMIALFLVAMAILASMKIGAELSTALSSR